MQPNGQQEAKPDSGVTLLGLVAFVSRTLATSVEVFLHRGFGERFLGRHSAAVILAVFVFAGLHGGDVRGLLAFLVTYLVACAFVHIGIMRRRRRGEVEHSFYNGRPFFLSWRIFKKVSEKSAKAVEPILVFLIGCLFMPVSHALGAYLMVASVGLLVSVGLAETYQRVRQLDLQDALIDQRIVANRLRGGRFNR